MKIFIDTANLDQIKEAESLGILDGVTTNPSLMAKEGISGKEAIRNHYLQIAKMVEGDVSAEVFSEKFEDMVKEGEELASIKSNIVVKIPCTKDGIKAIKALKDKGIRTNCTLIFNIGQAMLAAKAGASYVSPFIGRLDDIGDDGVALIGDIVAIFKNYNVPTLVLAASIRNNLHLIQCMQVGADVATAPLAQILGLLKHPLTESGLKTFMEDASKMK
ncbi:MAG: fructose-6-phosphate aldolase [Bacteroidales bacterium]|nr:fructose-6-phosphate aldolase [Bacteroidales bacterium]